MARLARWALRIAGGTALCLFVIGLIFLLSLRARPIDLGPFVPRIDQALERRLGVPVEIGGLRIAWDGWPTGVMLRAERVRVQEAGGTPPLRFASIGVGLDLQGGTIAPTRLFLERLRLDLVQTVDGDIRLAGAAEPAEDATGAQDAAEILRGLVGPPNPDSPLGELTEVVVRDSRVNLVDQRTGSTQRLVRVEARLGRTDDGATGTLSGQLRQAGKPASFSATVVHERASQRTDLEAEVGQLQTGTLAGILPDLPLEAVELTLDAKGSARFEGAHLARGSFELRSGPGTYQPTDPPTWTARIDRAAVAGRVGGGAAAVTIDRLELVSGATTITGEGRIGLADGRIEATLAAASVDVDEFRRLWPSNRAPGARQWVLANVTAGQMTDARVDLVLTERAGQLKLVPGTMSGGFGFDGLEVHYLRPMPPAQGLSGKASLGDGRLSFDVTQGSIGGLSLTTADVTIGGLDTPADDEQLDARLALAGRPADLLALLTHDPVGLDLPHEIAATAAGEVTGTIELQLDLNDVDAPGQPRLTYAADLADGAVDLAGDALAVRAAQLHVEGDRQALQVDGTARVAGIEGQLTGKVPFAAADPARLVFSGRLSEQDVARLVQSEAVRLSGPVGFEVALDPRQTPPTAQVQLDLAPTAIALPVLDWSKRAGAAASARVRVGTADGLLALDDIEIDAPGLGVSASARLRQDPLALVSVEASRLAVERTRARISLRRSQEGAYDATLNAEVLDLADIDTDAGGGGAGPAATIRADLKATSVLLPGERELSLVEGRIVSAGSARVAGKIEGRLPNGSRVRIAVDRPEAGSPLEFEADDAGAFLAWAGLGQGIRNGHLRLTGALPAEGLLPEGDGELLIRDFTATDAPVLGRLLTVASLTGLANLLGGEGIFFDRLKAPFTRTGTLLQIRDANARGSSLGITARGSVDLGAKRLDLAGAIVPLRGLNQAIANIPIIGQLLTGENREGIFAVNYTVRGPLGSPDIQANPLSALAPGIIRDIFTGIQSGGLEPPPAYESQRD